MADSIDLRSDTVTLPTPGMRKAMARAKVGDSQRLEDPSVRALEEHAASLFAKEAALFLPSGTMGNLCAVTALTRPGDLIVASSASQIAGREGPGVSHLAAVAIQGIDVPGGIFSADDVAEAIADAARWSHARIRLVTAENTHSAGGGTVFPITQLRRIKSFCRKAGIPFHIDGSRIFNASVASGVPVSEYGKACQSLMFSLTTGLGAPVGSVLVGSKSLIEEARAVSLRVGGGMRQAGIVAAGGLYALQHHVERLAEDHENARMFAEALAEIPGIDIVNAPVETNIVLFRWMEPTTALPAFREALTAKSLLLDDRSFPLLRAVTHLGISRKDIRRAVSVLGETLGRPGAASRK